LALTGKGCSDPFYDEGSRFASQVAKSAAALRKSGQTEAVFQYVPKYGVNQTIRVEIGRLSWCPQPPCYNEGAVTVKVERGESGTGYSISREASVPRRLLVEKADEPVRVHLRNVNGVIEVVGVGLIAAVQGSQHILPSRRRNSAFWTYYRQILKLAGVRTDYIRSAGQPPIMFSIRALA
jgi:hypothetical protein